MHNSIRTFFLILAVVMIAIPTIGQTDEPNIDVNCLGGKPNAPIRMEVFPCFQCPKVCIVYYEFPLKIPNYSREAARYGVAAQRIGRGPWQRISEALFLEQPQWEGGASIEADVDR